MGYLSAIGIAETETNIEQQLSWHFSSNCYPPVPQQMVPVAVEAIDLVVNEDGDVEIELPEQVSFRGRTHVSAVDVVESLHLWAFVEAQGEY
jgi:hypothetical protein